MQINLGKEGQLRFTNFCKLVKEIINNNEISHIVSGGNSGISLAEITLMIFDCLNIKRPNTLNIPFYRYYPDHRDEEEYKFDYSHYTNQIDQYVLKHKTLGNCLFVDDEIYQGNTALGIYKLLTNSCENHKFRPINKYFIIAEDQGFIIPEPFINIVFKPFAKEIEGYNNLIFAFIPSEFENPITEYFGHDDKLSFHLRMNLLLNLPVKDFNNGKPVFTDKLLIEGKQNISRFEKLQKDFKRYIKNEIQKAIVLRS